MDNTMGFRKMLQGYGYTEEQILEEIKEWYGTEGDINKLHTDEWKEKHTTRCPKCGGVATNQEPNMAGELIDTKFHCYKCDWEEDKMIKLEMSHHMFEIITEDISSSWTDVMCGNAKGESDIYRKDFFERVLPTIKITLENNDIFKYTMMVSEVDFITLYNEIIWGEHESFGTILYDWARKHTKELCSYLIKVKEENNLKSTLDDIKNLLWFMEEDGSTESRAFEDDEIVF